MVYYKNKEEIDLIRNSCIIVAKTLGEVSKIIKPGISTLQLDRLAEEFIRDNRAHPGFLNYRGYPNTLCTSINEEVVHGIPSKRVLKDGDIISVDCGVFFNGFYGDSAYTFGVGEISIDAQKLLITTKQSLFSGIEVAKLGRRIGDISFEIQSFVEKNGFSVVREMVGHGIGRNLHEEPDVPNYGKKGRGQIIKDGLVIAIEPMINLGKKDVVQKNDGWTIETKDKKISAHFEHTVAITSNGTAILSSFDYIRDFI